jgi:hypothetical protein
VRSPSLTQFGDGVRRACDLGRRADRVWRETANLHAEGLAGRARAFRAREETRRRESRIFVGGDGELWHDDDDRWQILRQFERDFSELRKEAGPWANVPDAPASRRQWWSAEALPALDEWRAFADGSTTSWARRAATEWSTYEDWLDRLRDLRSSARAHGLVLSSPEPADLPKTVHQRAKSGRGSDGEAWWTLGRVALYTALGIIGVISLG